MGKICVFFATGFEEIEALSVVDVCRRMGLEIQMVSITGEKEVTSSHQVTVKMDCLFDEVNFDEVDMLVLPGGMPGTKNLEAFAPLMEQVDSFYKAGKWIAAICAAPSIFGHKGVLEGRNACSFPEFESHLQGAEVTKNAVEVSDNVITSRGMGTAVDFGLKIAEVVKSKEEVHALAQKIVYSHLK